MAATAARYVFRWKRRRRSSWKIAIARYNVGKLLKGEWNLDVYPNQWEALVNIIKEKKPNKIGLNYSKNFALADGLVKTDFDELKANMPESITSKFVSAEKLGIAWIETRTEKEMELFRKLVKITHDIIDEAFSANTITPGKTSTEDVVWFLRQKVTDLGLETWFHPTIDIQRSNEALKSHIESFSKSKPTEIIQKGDLLHCDFGITYIGLNTDCQQHAYDLNDDECLKEELHVTRCQL